MTLKNLYWLRLKHLEHHGAIRMVLDFQFSMAGMYICAQYNKPFYTSDLTYRNNLKRIRSGVKARKKTA